MSDRGRFLFVVPPLAGHIRPTVPVGRELTARGHTVAWAAHPELASELASLAPIFIPIAKQIPAEVTNAVEDHTTKGTRGFAAFKSSWEEFVLPIARQMVPGVHAAVDSFTPDVLVVDQQALAGAVVAELRSLPWATTATTSAELVHPLASLPKLREWQRDTMTELLTNAGLPAERARELDPRFSPDLVLAFTSAELVGSGHQLPPNCELVGPSVSEQSDDASFPWEWFDQPGPHLLVSLGTLNWRNGERFFSVVAEAVRGMGAKAVIVAPPALLPGAPPDVLARPQVPQVALMPRVDAVVCHGGHNTVCESLSFSLPLVIAPIRDDQPFTAEQVRKAGAGVRVLFSRVTPDQLADALGTVLHEPSYRAAAERLRASFAGAGGPPVAADHLEDLLCHR